MIDSKAARLAFYVENEDEANIVFAASEAELEESGEWETIRREPGYDCYSEMPFVPAGLLVQNGWWFECWECTTRVDDDRWDYELDEPLEPVYRGRAVFCSSSCEHTYLEDMRFRKEKKDQGLQYLEKKFPGITIKGTFFTNLCENVSFNFPGGKYVAEWERSDKGEFVSIRPEDLEAWNAYAERVKKENSSA